MATVKKHKPLTRHATVSLSKSPQHPDKIDVTITMTVTEMKTITDTLSEGELNLLLAEYGLSPVALESLKMNHGRQMTQVFDLSE